MATSFTQRLKIRLEGWPIPSRITLDVDLYVENPTDASVELERLSYKVYINDKFIAEGTKIYILIPANSEMSIKIPVEITASDLLNFIVSLIWEGRRDINVDVKGVVNVPLKFFGVIKVMTVSVPFKVSKVYTIPLPWEKQYSPEAKPTTLILNPPPSRVREGSVITFTGKLIGAEGAIILGNVIEIYDDYWLGDDLIASASHGQLNGWILWTTVEVYAKFIGVGDYLPSKAKCTL